VPAGDGRLFLYDATSRAGWLIALHGDGGHEVVRAFGAGAFGAWTSVVSVPGARVLFYNAHNGSGVIGHFDVDGSLRQEWSTSAFSHGWSHVVATWGGDLLFYNRQSGAGRWGAITPRGGYADGGAIVGLIPGWEQIVPVGNRYLFFYAASTGASALGELLPPVFRTLGSQAFKTGWTAAACANGLLVLHDASTGEGYTGGFQGGTFVALRAYPPAAFGSGWELVCPLV
jgi:hypothetical protein